MTGNYAVGAYLLSLLLVLAACWKYERLGLAGMALAVLTAMMAPSLGKYNNIVGALVVGGALGTVLAHRMNSERLKRLGGAAVSLALFLSALGAIQQGLSAYLAVSLVLSALGLVNALLEKAWLAVCPALALAALGLALFNPFLVAVGGFETARRIPLKR
jgi:NAD/NADP transhydrogenase beta subunit